MGFRINTNIDALRAYQHLSNVNNATIKAQLRLSSGKRINNVADDTSGFTIGKSLEGKISVMKAAQNNVTAAKDLLTTAEGALLNINDLLIKIEGKLSDATNPTANITNIANDVKAISEEIQSLLDQTKYNDTSLLTAGTDNPIGRSAAGAFKFQIGSSLSSTINIDYAVALTSTNKESFNTSLSSFLNVTSATMTTTGTNGLDGLSTKLTSLKTEITNALGKVGNTVQRLNIKEDTLMVAITNANSSFSRLFDADFAMEQLNATRGSIISQASTAMLAQLNVAPQNVLGLFQ